MALLGRAIASEPPASALAEAANLPAAGFETTVGSPDIILWLNPDKDLSDVDAFRQQARDQRKTCPPILLVCDACPEALLRRALQLGLAGIVVRPFSAHRFAAGIARAARQPHGEYHLE